MPNNLSLEDRTRTACKSTTRASQEPYLMPPTIGDPAEESSQARCTHFLKASADQDHTWAATESRQWITAQSRRRILTGRESWAADDDLFRRFPVMVTATGMDSMGDYTVAIWATIGLVVVFTVPVVWQFMQPNDDDFGDLTKRRK